MLVFLMTLDLKMRKRTKKELEMKTKKNMRNKIFINKSPDSLLQLTCLINTATNN